MVEQSSDVGILKSIWTRSLAGIWSIHELSAIDLKPREGFQNDYFKISNELSLMAKRPGPIMDNLFASFGTTEFLVRQSIVPIVARREGDDEFRCIGTGFFISASGLLVTAGHVVRDPLDERDARGTSVDKRSHSSDKNLEFGILLPTNPAMKNAPFDMHPMMREAHSFMCPFEWTQHWGNETESPLIHKKPEFKFLIDVAVCKVKEFDLVGPYQPLNIGLHRLKLGDRAVAIGYPEMRSFRPGVDGYQPELVVSVGVVTNIHRDNITEKQNATPGPNFEFNARIPGKMSGSPILVGEGVITKGVVSRSWQDENHASGCLIAAMMRFPLKDGESLLNLMNRGNEGIAKVQGAGL